MSQYGSMVEIHDASPNQGGPFALFGFVGVLAGYRKTHENDITNIAKSQLTTLFG